MKSVRELLKEIEGRFQESNIQPPRLEAEKILAHALLMNRVALYCNFDRPVTHLEEKNLEIFIKRRLKDEPFAYVEGRAPFYSLELKVTPSVLIPRPETELLIEEIIKIAPKGATLLDLCTGSGAIALALKKERPDLMITGSDISLEAIRIAKENGVALNLEVEFLQGDFFGALEGRIFDLIVCNPPYISIAEWETLDPEVRLWEPKIALVGGLSGLEFYERLIKEAPTYLKNDGTLLFEMGYNQSESILKRLESSSFQLKKEVLDYKGILRHLVLAKK